jgi:hypothetical protein
MTTLQKKKKELRQYLGAIPVTTMAGNMQVAGTGAGQLGYPRVTGANT